jgi:hypothetical protein
MGRLNEPTLLSHLLAVAADGDWPDLLSPFRDVRAPEVSLHLAVLVEPYLSFLLEGQKTIESRFAERALIPYRRVDRDDIVLVKESGGPIVGSFVVAAAWFYELDPRSWHELREEFAVALCAQDQFWNERATAQFATLLRVSDVRRLPPVSVPKRDRRGWVVLADRNGAPQLFQ